MNNFRRKCLYILSMITLSVICNYTLRAQGTKVWRWEDAVREMERYNPNLASYGRSIVKSGYQLKGSYYAFLPSVGLSASGARRWSDTLSTTDGEDTYSLGISANLSLFSGFSDLNTVRIRQNDVTIAGLDFKRGRSDALYKLKTSFVGLVWSEESVALASRIVERREKNRDLVRLKYEGGREDKGSLMRVEADLIRAEYEENKSRREIFNAANNFLRAMGIEPPSSGGETLPARVGISLYDILPSSSIIADKSGVGQKPDFVKLAEETPEVMSAVIRLKKARLSSKISLSPFLPELSVGASISRSGNVFPPPHDNENRSISIGATWQIFRGGKDYFSYMASREDEKILEDNLRALKLSVASSLESAWRNLIDAYENLEVAKKYLDAARTQTEIITTRYLNGIATYQEWYQVENDYISAEKSLLNASRDVILSEAYWKNLLGEDKDF